MPALRNCSFCGRKMEPGSGTLYVRNDGTMSWFCSKKCRKNALELGRNPRRMKWVMKAGPRREDIGPS